MLAGYVQSLNISDNEFTRIGDSAVPAPFNISMTTCQIQTRWSPHSERAFER